MNIDWILVQKIKEREKEGRVRGREGGREEEKRRKEEGRRNYEIHFWDNWRNLNIK